LLNASGFVAERGASSGGSVFMGLWFQRVRSRMLVLAYDLVMLALAWALAYWTRFNLGRVPPELVIEAGRVLPLVLLVVGSVYWGFGLYRGVWRFASLTDLGKIV